MVRAGGNEREQSQNCFLGSVNLPPRDDVPNRALVFMFGGLTSRGKPVVAYHFTRRSLDDILLKDFFFTLQKFSFDVGLKVLVVSSDMAAANKAMWRELELSSIRTSDTIGSVPHSCIHERQLYLMANVALLLKKYSIEISAL